MGTFSIREIAENVRKAANRLGIDVTVDHLENPRIELEEHFYEADHQKLLDLGLEPHRMVDALETILKDLIAYKDREAAKENVIAPKIQWRETEEAASKAGHTK